MRGIARYRSALLLATLLATAAGAAQDAEAQFDALPPDGRISVLAVTDRGAAVPRSDVVVRALPDGATLGPVLVKVYSPAGRLVNVFLRAGGRAAALDISDAPVAHGQRLAVSAVVFDPPGGAPRARKAAANADVFYRPHLTLAVSSAPSALTTGRAATFTFVAGEDNGEFGAIAHLTFSDGSVLGESEVTIPAGGSVPVSFTASFGTPGPHVPIGTLTLVSLATAGDPPPVTAFASVTVYPPPSIASFTASPAGLVAPGTVINLLPDFSGGVGTISPGAIPVTTGTIFSTGIAETSTYELMVLSPVGEITTAYVTVTVDKTTATLGTAGGFVQSPSGASVQIPFGALDHDTQIQISSSRFAPPAGALSPLYDFQPDGLLFARPVRVSLPVPPGTTSASIYWSSLDGTRFEPIGGIISNGVITAETPHFSVAYVGPAIPTRTVNGLGQITWISAYTRDTRPIDFVGQSVEALVRDSGGNLVSIPGIPGTGAAVGTFTIPGVANGEYILRFGNQYLVTSSSSPDLGRQRGGRPVEDRTFLQTSGWVWLDLLNVNAWQDGDNLEFYDSEADNWDFNSEGWVNQLLPSPGDTNLGFWIDMRATNGSSSGGNSPIRATDHPLVAQLSLTATPSGLPYLALSRVVQLPAFDQVDGVDTVLPPLTMSDVARTNSISVDYRGSQWANVLQGGNPAQDMGCAWPTCGASFGVLAQAGSAEDGFYGSNADLLLVEPPSGDGVVGPFEFGSPSVFGGTWGPMFDMRQFAIVRPSPLPGTVGLSAGLQSNGLPSGIEWVASLEKGSTQPIAPPVSMPLGVTVSGLDFFAGGTGVGATPTLSWSRPSIGQPAVYRLLVRRLFANANRRTAVTTVANLITPETSLTLPPGILQPGQTYVFTLAAIAATSSDAATLVANAPFKFGLDLATATTCSGEFTP